MTEWRKYYGRGGTILYRRVVSRRKPVTKSQVKRTPSFEELPEEVRRRQEAALRAAGDGDK